MSLDLTDGYRNGVINYIGIVRGATQRLIKKELNHEPDDELIYFLDNILSGLSNGSDELNLIKLDSEEFQTMLINAKWLGGYQKHRYIQLSERFFRQLLYELSEDYFELANDTVFTAEEYTEHTVQNARKSLVFTNIIFGLMAFGCSVSPLSEKVEKFWGWTGQYKKSEQLSKQIDGAYEWGIRVNVCLRHGHIICCLSMKQERKCFKLMTASPILNVIKCCRIWRTLSFLYQ